MAKTLSQNFGNRILSIDILRALTMLLMIFVNDLWSLTGVPDWLKHTAAQEDGMGFSDVIFPLFLFIVGLSIPLAFKAREKKNESKIIITKHILERTLALLVMGFYMVNYESINSELLPISKYLWQIFMALAIVLIWMDYKRIPNISTNVIIGLKVFGILILLYLAWIYKGGSAENITWMKRHWWGILGLIGWSYLLNSIIYLYLGKRIGYLSIALLLLLFMNVQENNYFESFPSFQLVISASNHVLVMAGVLCTAFYLKFKNEGKQLNHYLGLAFTAGIIFIAYGFLIRPEFPISKILATPSWTAICIGIGLISYIVFYIFADILGFSKWANPIKPAGTSTLTCYLMPYFIYPIIVLLGFKLPEALTDGIIGLGKSFLFSFLIVVFVGILERRNLRLKI